MGVVTVFGVVVAVACSDSVSRPAPAGDCTDPACSSTHSATGLGDVGGAFTGTAGSGSMSPAAGSAELTGNIQVVVEPDLAHNGALATSLQIHAAGELKADVSAATASSGSFTLPDVNPSTSLWVGVGAFDGNAAGTYMDTLQVVDSTAGLPVNLLVIQRSTFQQILSESFQLGAVEPDPNAGNVIIRFVDSKRNGISGVTLLDPKPEQTSVVYDQGATYSDQTGETSDRGTMVLVNLPSHLYPGAGTPLAALVDGKRYDIEVRTAAGTVTMVTAQKPDP